MHVHMYNMNNENTIGTLENTLDMHVSDYDIIIFG